MELIRISEGKLKVILSEEDLRHYAVSAEELDYKNAATRRAVRAILTEAEERLGFVATGDRMYIQVYAGRHGGCELYITWSGDIEEERPKKGALYRFSGLFDLISACAVLAHLGYTGESTAYAEETEAYLVLYGAQAPVLAEYGEAVSGRERLAYIEEHAAPLARRNAIAMLAPLK